MTPEQMLALRVRLEGNSDFVRRMSVAPVVPGAAAGWRPTAEEEKAWRVVTEDGANLLPLEGVS